MSVFNRIRKLDNLLVELFNKMDNISIDDSERKNAWDNMVEGFKTVFYNIHNDLLDPYYEQQNPNIEEKIIERLEGLLKLISIFVDFEN
jgi:hypothetical protein